MPMCLVDVDIDGEPRRLSRSATRRRSVSFLGSRSTGTGTITSHKYESAPRYILPIPPPPPPPPPPLANLNSTGSGWRNLPGTFPEEANSVPYSNYHTFSAVPARESAPRTPLRRKSLTFGDYIPNPLSWTSGLFKKDNIAPSTPITTTEKMAALTEAVEHERTLRMYAEQSHQETIRQQLLELELKKATQELQQKEDAARQRLLNVSALAEQHQHAHKSALISYGFTATSTALVPPPPPSLALTAPAPTSSLVVTYPSHYHHSHHYYVWKYGHLSPEEIAVRRYRREHHHCSRCDRLGHYSKECRSSPHPRRRSPSPAVRPPKGYLSRPSSAAGYSTDDEEWELISDSYRRENGELYYDDVDVDDDGYPIAKRYRDDDWELEVRGEKRDNGVLVTYDGGAAPGKVYPKNSVRHVIGA